jgi:parallel beta-helix repeat protein
LGGINLVDYNPYDGDYTNTIVRKNTILGGFANDGEEPGDSKGSNYESAIIKIGIAIGPRTWFGDKFGQSRNRNGIVQDNIFSGAFSYGIAVTSADNFTVLGNELVGNTTFIGGKGPNCSETDSVPEPYPWIVDWATVGTDMNDASGKLQDEFVGISDGDSLTCVLPPNGGDFWPFGLNPSNGTGSSGGTGGTGTVSGSSTSGSSPAGIAVGVIVGVLAVGLGAFFGRKYFLRKMEEKKHFNNTKEMTQRPYTQKLEH